MSIGPIIPGEAFRWGREFIDADDKPFDLSGYVVVFLYRDAAGATVHEKRSDRPQDRVTLTETSDAVDSFLTPEETTALAQGGSVVIKLTYSAQAVSDDDEWVMTLFADDLFIAKI